MIRGFREPRFDCTEVSSSVPLQVGLLLSPITCRCHRDSNQLRRSSQLSYLDMGKTKSYLQRFKIIDNPMCPYNEGAQSSNHLIYNCKILERQRSTLKQLITTSGGTWPTSNSDLVAKYSHAFPRFIKSIDFQQLQ